MEKTESSTRGKIVLATVKGDVHDIGKNLVEIILSNNGYQVINLGIKVPPEDLIRAWREHKPDAIGLSGLLVKSAHQMVTTASDFKDHGVEVPLLVGGAALSERFTITRIDLKVDASVPGADAKVFADAAFYSVGGQDPAKPEVVPFLLKRDAEAYAGKNGGKLATYSEALGAIDASR